MNELTAASQESTMSSADLYALVCRARTEYLETTPRLNDFHARLVDELDGENYESFVVENPNKTSTTYHRLTIDQCLLVGMRESKAVRRYIKDKLKQLAAEQAPTPPTPQLPQTYLEALEQLVEKEKKLIEQAPKVALVENLMEREALVNATQVGLPHNLSAQALNKILVEYGGVYNQAIKRGKVFTKEWVSKGYGEVKITPSGHNQSLFTPAGQVRVNEILITEGIV